MGDLFIKSLEQIKSKHLNDRFWNNIAEKTTIHYRSNYVSEYHKYENENLLKEWCGSLENKKILITDLFNEAFGRDELKIIFGSSDADIIGMDISNFIVEKFHKKYPLHKKLVCDVSSLPFKDNKFDIVVSPSTLDHFPQSDLEISLQEIRRILKRGGFLILYLHNKFNIFLHFYQIKIKKIYPFPIELYSKREVVKILNKNKFSILDCTATMHILFPTLVPLILGYLEKINARGLFNLLFKNMFYFSKLRNKKTKYLTGKFITVKALKV